MIFEFTAHIQVEWDEEDTYDKLSIGEQMIIDEAVKETVDTVLRTIEGTIDVNDTEMEWSITQVTG